MFRAGDHRVTFRREETLAQDALEVRRYAGVESNATFNIVELIRKISLGIISRRLKFRPFKIVLFDAGEYEKPAYVEFKPLTLYVDRECWSLASQGEQFSRFVLAHEIAHLLLHDHLAKAFSNDPSEQIKAFVNEESAEWHANTFAGHLLLPDSIVLAMNDIFSLVHSCQAPREIAQKRLNDLKHQRGPRYLGESCPDCGNFTVLPNGIRLICDTCQSVREIFAPQPLD